MTTYRKLSGKQRAEHGDPPPYNIRFDYSNTYLDNEDLNLQLEDQADELHRERFRMCVETDEILKKTKQNANEMLQLKNAIKNRDPYESSDRVLKSADLKRRPSTRQLKNSELVAHENVSKSTSELKRDTYEKQSSEKEQEELGETQNKLELKPLNTLTMFLLSLQTFKRHDNQRKEDAVKKSLYTDMHSKPSTEHTHSTASIRHDRFFCNRPASCHHREQDKHENLRNNLVTDKKEESQYGLHVRKDFTRSRRKLEEISKLEQDSKYGFVDKYEERRKKLLAACRDTRHTDERIKLFLQDVEEFKMISSADNSLERVLMRTKSANFARNNTFAW